MGEKVENRCLGCRKLDNLINVKENIKDTNVQWITTLIYCIPELSEQDLKVESHLCTQCSEVLCIIKKFKENCLKSYKEQKIIKQNASPSKTRSGVSCFQCGANFSRKTVLEKHMKIHAEKEEIAKNKKHKNHTCPCCDSVFTIKKKLEIHKINCFKDGTTASESEVDLIKRWDEFQQNSGTKNEADVREEETDFIIYKSDSGDDEDVSMTHEDSPKEKKWKSEKSDMVLLIISDSTDADAQNQPIKDVKVEEAVKTETKPKVKRGRKPITKTLNKCESCLVMFTTKYLLNRHTRNVHATEKNHNCDICGQKFASPVYLAAHKKYHSGDRTHICSFCGKGYITASDLYHHEKIHANKRAYKCDKCPKAFNTSSDLHKHHICVHKDRSEWKYVCAYCNRRFPLKTNLDTHTKTHTGERNHACHLCERRCINKSVLQRHIESHSNVRTFKCAHCPQDYKYQKSLDIHLTRTHGIGDTKIPDRVKKYFCHICPKSYFANNKLQKHIRSHTGERPFSCQMCEKKFIDKSYVKQHLKTAHNVTLTGEFD